MDYKSELKLVQKSTRIYPDNHLYLLLSILDNIETIYYNLDATERKRFWSSFIDVITIDGNYNIDIKFL